jgi:hypothetical protein
MAPEGSVMVPERVAFSDWPNDGMHKDRTSVTSRSTWNFGEELGRAMRDSPAPVFTGVCSFVPPGQKKLWRK